MWKVNIYEKLTNQPTKTPDWCPWRARGSDKPVTLEGEGVGETNLPSAEVPGTLLLSPFLTQAF